MWGLYDGKREPHRLNCSEKKTFLLGRVWHFIQRLIEVQINCSIRHRLHPTWGNNKPKNVSWNSDDTLFFPTERGYGKGHCTSVTQVMAGILTAAFQPRFTNCTSIFVAKTSTTASSNHHHNHHYANYLRWHNLASKLFFVMSNLIMNYVQNLRLSTD